MGAAGSLLRAHLACRAPHALNLRHCLPRRRVLSLVTRLEYTAWVLLPTQHLLRLAHTMSTLRADFACCAVLLATRHAAPPAIG